MISDAVNKTRGNQNNINIQIKNQNNNFSNNKELANYCNDYFVNIGTNIYTEINYHSVNSMFLESVNEYDIIKQINSLKNSSAPGITRITTTVIKYSHNHLTKPLIYIINLIFMSFLKPEP